MYHGSSSGCTVLAQCCFSACELHCWLNSADDWLLESVFKSVDPNQAFQFRQWLSSTPGRLATASSHQEAVKWFKNASRVAFRKGLHTALGHAQCQRVLIVALLNQIFQGRKHNSPLDKMLFDDNLTTVDNDRNCPR